MISFLNLSRKLELVVARAAGVSAWQFITPPLLVVVAIGVVMATLYNPASTAMKRQSDRLEAKLFGAGANNSAGVWIRQKSVDGESVVHADGRGNSGSSLTHVQVFNFDANGGFLERVDAEDATLHDGYWRLDNANVVTPGFNTLATNTYFLATNLTEAEVAQAFVAPETVSFWALPGLAAQTDRAGLDATGYRLRFQELLALPLTLAAMVLVAACFSLRFFRMGGVQKMVSGGVAAGFVLYVATKLVNDLGGAGFVSVPSRGGRRPLSAACSESTCFCTRRMVDGPLHQLSQRERTPRGRARAPGLSAGAVLAAGDGARTASRLRRPSRVARLCRPRPPQRRKIPTS